MESTLSLVCACVIKLPNIATNGVIYRFFLWIFPNADGTLPSRLDADFTCIASSVGPCTQPHPPSPSSAPPVPAPFHLSFPEQINFLSIVKKKFGMKEDKKI